MVSNAEVARRYDIENVPNDHFDRIVAFAELDARRFTVALFLTLALHFATIGRALAMQTGLHAFAADVDRQLSHTRMLYEIHVDEPPPPPPPPPEPEPEKEPEPVKAVPAAAAPPPAPAQAGKVLAADPDPNEPVDLTGNTFVQGDADSYVGGVTSSKGTGTQAVYSAVASGTGPPGPPPSAPAAPKQDLSRSAKPVSESWNCGFPPEADIEQINYARVSIAVTVGADGTATNASLVSADPGYGFGALAKRCAMRMRYDAARNKEGSAITQTQVVNINFKR
jgi:protein TonB